jgi:hypothetical protein
MGGGGGPRRLNRCPRHEVGEPAHSWRPQGLSHTTMFRRLLPEAWMNWMRGPAIADVPGQTRTTAIVPSLRTADEVWSPPLCWRAPWHLLLERPGLQGRHGARRPWCESGVVPRPTPHTAGKGRRPRRSGVVEGEAMHRGDASPVEDRLSGITGRYHAPRRSALSTAPTRYHR